MWDSVCTSRYNWWLSVVTNATNFANVNNNGNANNNDASNTWVGIRPISNCLRLTAICSCLSWREKERKPFSGLLEMRWQQSPATALATASEPISAGLFIFWVFGFSGMGELFDNAVSVDALYEAYRLSRKESDWKASVQKFEMNAFPMILQLHNELVEGTYKQCEFYEFTLRERGKTRRIKSLHFRDRVVQRSVCDNIILPSLLPYLNYDNGASVKGKGITFARNRIQCHLEKFVRKHGRNGYILQVDYSKFFDNIRHEVALKDLSEKIDDPVAMTLIEDMVGSFAVNVGHLSNEEIENLYNGVYNSVSFVENTNPKQGDKMLRKSLGIGSQISQLIGIHYLTRVDNFVKTVRGCKFYGRYMDDLYVIHESKEFLEKLLKEITEISSSIGLTVNPVKTQITSLNHEFTFMQVRYKITNTGRIIKRLARAKVIRERRKLKAYKRLLEGDVLTRKEISNAYQSWRGNNKNFNSYKTIKNMDKFYNSIFGVS